MSLRSKILAIMAIPLVVLVMATFALLLSRQRTTDALASEREAVVLRETLDRILVDLTNAETGSRGYLLTGKTSFLEPYTEGSRALAGDMQALRRLAGESGVTVDEIAELQLLANQRLSLLQVTQLMAPVTDLTNHTQLIAEMTSGTAVMDKIRELVARQEARANRLLTERRRSLDGARHASFLIAIVGMPVGLLVSLIVVTVFTQRLVSRIRKTEEFARMLEEGMPLGEASTSDDELGRLERVLVRSGTRVVELQDELRRMATADPLTRLINRRGFVPTAEHQLEVAKRHHQPMALMFLDLDGLKDVNDTLGHASGDAMITEAAYVMRETFRASDLIGRMGGDEFCVLFAAESMAAARTAVARLHAAVVKVNEQEGRPFVLAFSAGVAMFDPEDPCTLDRLMAIADEQMYEAKRSKGRAGSYVTPVA